MKFKIASSRIWTRVAVSISYECPLHHEWLRVYIYIYIYIKFKHVLSKTTEYFLLRIFKWRRSSLLIFLMSGSRCWRKCPILTQALLAISLVVLRGCIWFFVAVSCYIYLEFIFSSIYLAYSVSMGSSVSYWICLIRLYLCWMLFHL